jgi:hypothetical protein
MYIEHQLAIMVERFGGVSNPLEWARNRFAQAIGGISSVNVREPVQMRHPPITGVRHPSITEVRHQSTTEGCVTAPPKGNFIQDRHYEEPSPMNEQNDDDDDDDDDVDGEMVFVDKRVDKFHAEHGRNQRGSSVSDYVQKGVWVAGSIAIGAIRDACADTSENFGFTLELEEGNDGNDGDGFSLIVPAQ